MKDNKEECKISFYDKFKCTADKCSLTCCSGWDISVDDETFKKWQDSNNKYCSSCSSDYMGRIMKKETAEDCPFLDKDKLCLIVKNSGDDYLSDTCRTFPRIINNYDDRVESSLSCACPEVVEIILRCSNIEMSNEDLSSDDNIRKMLLKIIKDQEISLEYRLILCYSMINDILDAGNKREEEAVKARYNDEAYLKELADYYKNMQLDIHDSLAELNSLFADITENYRNVKLLKTMMADVCNYADKIDVESAAEKYHDFRKSYEEYDELNMKCIISKIYNIFVDADTSEIAVNFEMIILEYILARYAVFLRYCINNQKIMIEDVKESIAVFTRIISSNSDAVREFITDGFDSEILDIGYLCFISLM